MRRGMKKVLAAMTTAVGLMVLASFPAFAGQWQQDDGGWWWKNEDGSYPVGQWVWIDGNHDGEAENYYFNEKGYLLTNAEIQGTQVNEAGARVIDGVVCTTRISAGCDWYPGKELNGESCGSCAEGKRTTAMAADIDLNDPANVDAWWNQQEWETVSGDMVIEDYRGERTEEDEGDEEKGEEIDPYELAYRIVELVNEERERKGKDELEINDELMESAMVRAEEVSEFFSHTRPDGSLCSTAITISYSLMAENVIWEKVDAMENIAQFAIGGWLDSSRHKVNMLNSKYKETGVGVYIKENKIYIVQVFIKK